MVALTDVLNLTEPAAKAQWQQIQRRTPQARQGAFLPVELVLSYALFFEIDPHRFGGSNIHLLPPFVVALAQTCLRSPGSFTYKMLNLDGSRPNAGRVEPQLFLRLSLQPDVLRRVYLAALRGARTAGLSDDAVPDFLGMLGGDDMKLMGQDEIGPGEVYQLVDENAAAIRTMNEGIGLDAIQTYRVVEHRARLGQHRFARAVLRNYAGQCGFCGFAPKSLPKSRMLVASHIKPWREASSRERLDPRNGIAACPIHDTAFDSGLLAVNGGLRIHRHRRLRRSVAQDPGSDRFFSDAGLRERLLVPASGVAPNARYLRWHKLELFDSMAE